MNDVARQLSASAAPGPHVAVALADRTSFRAFGATLGAVCLGYSLQGLRDGADAREAVGVVVNAAGLGSSVAGLVLKNGAPKVLTHGLPVVGYALSAFDTVNALKRGDEVGAVAAAAPLAGALSGAAIGAGTGSFAPGIGTAGGTGGERHSPIPGKRADHPFGFPGRPRGVDNRGDILRGYAMLVIERDIP